MDPLALYQQMLTNSGGYYDAPMQPQLPPQDELLRAVYGQPHGSLDPGIVARPYSGPMTGDPVIGPRMGGTFDRGAFLFTPERKYQLRNPPYLQMPVGYGGNLGFGPREWRT